MGVFSKNKSAISGEIHGEIQGNKKILDLL